MWNNCFRHWPAGSPALWCLKKGKQRKPYDSPIFLAASNFPNEGIGSGIPDRAQWPQWVEETEIRVRGWGSQSLKGRDTGKNRVIPKWNFRNLCSYAPESLLTTGPCLQRVSLYKTVQKMSRWAEHFQDLTAERHSRSERPEWRVLSDHSGHFVKASDGSLVGSNRKAALFLE